MSLYFAYGSNMDQNQMLERCPNAQLLGRASLADYRLAFTIFSPKRECGCADIISSTGDMVYGLLYRLADTDMITMDDFEGHPIHYRRITVLVKSKNGEVEAYSYEVVNKKKGLRPSVHYLVLLQSAAKHFEFPKEYQEFILNVRPI
jgi:gamma-glutamylcyclotransferase (GGCT)/AIG2-like uncharacterized protein YtfP